MRGVDTIDYLSTIRGFAMNCKTNKLAVAVFVACNTGFFAYASDIKISAHEGTERAAVEQALGHLNTKSSSASASKGDSFVARDVIIDVDGAQHVRFDRKLHGLRMIGGDVVVHSNASGEMVGMTHSMVETKAQSLAKRYAQDLTVHDGAEVAARNQGKAMFLGASHAEPIVEKVFYARDREPTLAFDVLVKGMSIDGTPSEMHYIIDAASNTLLDSFDNVRTLMSRDVAANLQMLATFESSLAAHDSLSASAAAPLIAKSVSSLAKAATTGTGNSLISGVVSLTTNSISGGYELRDPSRGSHYASNLSGATSGNGTIFTDLDNIWGNSATTSSKTAAVDAVYGQNLTWDFYKGVLGRTGIANDGRGAFSRVHYGSNYANAFWNDSCFCMTYGDGNGSTVLPLVAIDVAGHEMTHGVTSRTAGLIYSGESGGLNEAISDMVGTSVEFYANNANSRPNYLIGERVYAANNGVATPTTALRYMFKPSLDGKSPDCYTSTIGSLNVHYSSGVANHFFYLLSEGAVSPPGFNLSASQLVCNGNTSLAAIGRTAAIKIVYRALTTYMTASTNYKGARTATLNAATDLYGGTSAQYNAVAAAWSAVSVN
jgi:zinc metalloprotease ZmpA